MLAFSYIFVCVVACFVFSYSPNGTTVFCNIKQLLDYIFLLFIEMENFVQF